VNNRLSCSKSTSKPVQPSLYKTRRVTSRYEAQNLITARKSLKCQQDLCSALPPPAVIELNWCDRYRTSPPPEFEIFHLHYQSSAGSRLCSSKTTYFIHRKQTTEHNTNQILKSAQRRANTARWL